jgi:hypothetical protein
MALRKTIAQVGVISYMVGTGSEFLISFVPIALPQYAIIGSYTLGFFALILFLVVGAAPSNETEEWGSMWPLVGYDNAIDAVYTRGPWRIRFEEMDELDVQKNITEGMTMMFGD